MKELIYKGTTYKIGQLVEMKDKSVYEIHTLEYFPDDQHCLTLPYFKANANDPKYPNINAVCPIKDIKKIISEPLPFTTSKRGGSRPNSGRPRSGRKESKLIRVDLAIAKKLPDLEKLLQLLEDYRDSKTSINPSYVQNAKSEFFRQLDQLPPLLREK